MNLTERISDTNHFFKDEKGRTQGEYKSWYDADKQNLNCHCFYKDGKVHGEYISMYSTGDIVSHYILVNDNIIHRYPDKLTDEDKFELCLKHGHMEFL